MPSPTTVLQLSRDALDLTNAVGVDQTLTADEVSLCLRVFNDLVEDWSTQSMAVFGLASQTFNTAVAQAVYTIGTGGNWNTARPERINDPAYATINSVTFPYASMTQGQYDLIAYKAQTGGGTDLVQRYLYVNEFPLGLVTLWPVPNAIFPITFSIDRVLTQVSSAAASVSFPQGYAKAFLYCLGCELAPRFGKKMADYPEVMAIRDATFGNIKRANTRKRVMSYDPAYTDRTSAAWVGNWRSG